METQNYNLEKLNVQIKEKLNSAKEDNRIHEQKLLGYSVEFSQITDEVSYLIQKATGDSNKINTCKKSTLIKSKEGGASLLSELKSLMRTLDGSLGSLLTKVRDA